MQQGYHFPPPDPDSGYGYGNQQLVPGQQWGQPQPDPRGYELAYQNYAPADPGPFPAPAPHPQQQQGYADTEPDYSEEFYDDDEPRRGKRWILITVALIGAIGVGGALAYGYRSFVAPHSGRVPVVKADPNVKAKPDLRGGKEFAGAERRPPVRSSEDQSAAPEATEEAPAENQGPRPVKSIPIGPSGVAAAPEPAPAPVPGITLYRPPQLPGQQAPAAAPPPAQPQSAPRAVQPGPPSRVVIGSRPPAAEAEEEAPTAPPPARRSVPVQTAAVAPKLAPARPREVSSGLGYVAVLFTEKTSMDALKKFADMQQAYTDVLVDRTPDVQEADLSERGLGIQYRLVVGPPGSRNAASGVCAQLKSAGYSGCWVKEY